MTKRILFSPLVLLCIFALLAPSFAQAEEKGVEKRKAGPNGGRVISETEPPFEFFVREDRKIAITFLSEAGEPIVHEGPTITLIGGDRRNPTSLDFAAEGQSLLSEGTLPEGEMVPVVIRVKMTPEAKMTNVKFTVNLSDCPECDYREYACICGHEDES